MNRLNSIPGNGITILCHLHEVMTQIQLLASKDCHDQADVLRKCNEELVGISIDIASVISPNEDWDKVSELLHNAGITIPEGLDKAMREAD